MIELPEVNLDQVIFLDLPKTRVCLRPVDKKDVPFLKWAMNNEAITKYMQIRSPFTMEDEEEWYSRVSKKSESQVVLVIALKPSHKPIGTISINSIQPSNRTGVTGTVIGYEELLGKGLGTEAKMLLLHHAFNTLNLRQIYSSVFSFNARSLAYAKKCGYEKYAVTPEHLYRDGEYHDIHHFRVTRDMWLPKWEKFKEEMS